MASGLIFDIESKEAANLPQNEVISVCVGVKLH